jgi:hypothetical protein
MDLRKQWGGGLDQHHSHLGHFPHYYDEVKVCRLCAQFFTDPSIYRPDVLTHAVIEVQEEPKEEEEDEEFL